MTTGILLTNIGSPDQPTPKAVRAYLKKFLTDPRVVQLPKLLWWPILYGYILPVRSRQSAKLYQKIWTREGSPLTVYSQALKEKLQNLISLPIEIGMHYGNPSIEMALQQLNAQHVKKIIILPLYPQYSASTTGSAFDSIMQTLASWREIPETHLIKDYADHPAYIDAITTSIQSTWETSPKPDHLLFSFHGLPKRFCDLGDPYAEQCQLTARLVAEKLELESKFWSISFQSRLGRAEWLTPYTHQVLKILPKQQHYRVDVICPGFAVDCLETLEEIAIRGKEQFAAAGGKFLRYIPALNATDLHIRTLQQILDLNSSPIAIS